LGGDYLVLNVSLGHRYLVFD